MHRESLQSRSAIYLGRKQLRSFYRVSARKCVDRSIGYIVIKNESNGKEWNNYWDLVYWNWSFLSISIWDFMILLFWWKGIIYTKTFCFLAMTIIWIVPCGYKVNCSSTQCMPCFSFFWEKQYGCHGLKVLACINVNLVEGLFQESCENGRTDLNQINVLL